MICKYMEHFVSELQITKLIINAKKTIFNSQLYKYSFVDMFFSNFKLNY